MHPARIPVQLVRGLCSSDPEGLLWLWEAVEGRRGRRGERQDRAKEGPLGFPAQILGLCEWSELGKARGVIWLE